ncbi:unnamed protein product, partial [Effrenium voratum]
VSCEMGPKFVGSPSCSYSWNIARFLVTPFCRWTARAWTAPSRIEALVVRADNQSIHFAFWTILSAKHRLESAGRLFTLWLKQLDQSALPSMSILCALASAQRQLPHDVPKSRLASLWLREVQTAARKKGLQMCNPNDLNRVISRLSNLAATDAVQLVADVDDIRMACRTQAAIEAAILEEDESLLEM